MHKKTIGIVGAGKLGITLAQLARRAGYSVYISGSESSEKIRLAVETLAPGATTTTTEGVAENTQIIILSLPLGKFRRIPKDMFAGKLIIDAMNHWWEVDGSRHDIVPKGQSSSEAVRDYFSDARVVKALSHMGYHHLHDEAKPAGMVGRKAVAFAGESKDDSETVAKIINDFGFDPVFIGPLGAGASLEPGSPAFGANLDASTLRRVVEGEIV